MKNVHSLKTGFQESLTLSSPTINARSRAAKRHLTEYESLARTRLSENFILRDFLFSTEAACLSLDNFPQHPHRVIAAGQALCEKILEPILARFGRFAITYGYASRTVLEAALPESERQQSCYVGPHCWDQFPACEGVFARVDILPFCVADQKVERSDFGRWCMMNLDVDLLMQWTRSNVYCISISPRPRRVWLEWGNPKLGQPRQTIFMGADYWQRVYPASPEHERPKFAPSCTGGSMQWGSAK